MAKADTKKTESPKVDSAEEVDAKTVLFLANCGRPKSFLKRLSPAERKQMASVWDKHAPPKKSFKVEAGKVWAERAGRLEALKATESEA